MALSDEQVDMYLDRIDLPQKIREELRLGQHNPDALEAITKLQQYHMVAVPFENLELHYSPTHRPETLSIENVFDSVVRRKRGGVCLAVHLLFAELLRSFGFAIYCTAGRTNTATYGIPEVTQATGPTVYGIWTHVTIIAEIHGQNYLIGATSRQIASTMPIPLVHDVPVEDMPFRQCRMLHSDLPGSDPKRQNLWWRKQLRTVDGETRGPWVDMLCFQEVEWQTLDFYVLLTGLGSLGSWLNTRVICLRFIPGTEQRPVGYYYIWGNILYRLLEGKVTVLEIFYTERDRTQALQRWFNITLTEQEKEGIIGWNTELKHGGDEYDYYGG